MKTESEQVLTPYQTLLNQLEIDRVRETLHFTVRHEENIARFRAGVLALRESCQHHQYPERVEPHADYHHGTDWEEFYCSNCNIRLRSDR